MHPVQSSCLAAVGYDAAQGLLRLRYLNGATYDHPGVPLQEYENLLSADSKGRYVNLQIKPRYQVRRVN